MSLRLSFAAICTVIFYCERKSWTRPHDYYFERLWILLLHLALCCCPETKVRDRVGTPAWQSAVPNTESPLFAQTLQWVFSTHIGTVLREGRSLSSFLEVSSWKFGGSFPWQPTGIPPHSYSHCYIWGLVLINCHITKLKSSFISTMDKISSWFKTF